MTYKITCLTMTRKDPHRRGHRPVGAGSGVMIGIRSVRAGETITISDPLYNRIKKNVDYYKDLGLITLEKLPERSAVQPAASIEKLTATPEIIDAVVEAAVAVEEILAELPAPTEVTGNEPSAEPMKEEPAKEEPAKEEPVKEEPETRKVDAAFAILGNKKKGRPSKSKE